MAFESVSRFSDFQAEYEGSIPFTSNPDFKPDKPFRGRLILINRGSVPTEIPPQAFAEAHQFRWLTEDDLGVNPALFFEVEAFAATDTFNPTKPYTSRIKWSDPEGNEQRKLLLTPPETLVMQVLRGDGTTPSLGNAPDRPSRSRPGRKEK